MADVEGVREPRPVVGVLLGEAEVDEGAAQERDPRLRHAEEHRRHERIVRRAREGDLDRVGRRLVHPVEDQAQALGGVVDGVGLRDQLRRVLPLPERERRLDQRPPVLEVPVEAPARRADLLRQAVDRDRGDAALGERAERGADPVLPGQASSCCDTTVQ